MLLDGYILFSRYIVGFFVDSGLLWMLNSVINDVRDGYRVCI